jgi:hypothetical protein
VIPLSCAANCRPEAASWADVGWLGPVLATARKPRRDNARVRFEGGVEHGASTGQRFEGTRSATGVGPTARRQSMSPPPGWAPPGTRGPPPSPFASDVPSPDRPARPARSHAGRPPGRGCSGPSAHRSPAPPRSAARGADGELPVGASVHARDLQQAVGGTVTPSEEVAELRRGGRRATGAERACGPVRRVGARPFGGPMGAVDGLDRPRGLTCPSRP